ncbi:MAG: YafY family transcriptional regulator [Balneolaceae bacterium]|nr:YafY family transcriptional regulator [Balneolaceae bacterium]MBO6545547.1 YafY family transcriptional regulator [Balneolaceae bacterium]MBO6646943.1 YafY family transcriptional regulator [Balneolaceae bacterium]
MNSSERRLKLMLLLQQPGKKLTVEEIAEKFGVSRRTIFRDFNVLQEINVPVTWDKYSGYGVMPGYKVPPLMFTSKELATIMVGLNFVKSQVDKQLVEDAQGVELKIKNVLPDELKELMISLESKTIVDPYLKFGGEKKDGGDWYLLSSAIAQKNRVQFLYTTKSGETSVRKVDPYILVFYEDHWNMIGKSHIRGEVRNFILDQMQEIEILDEKIKEEKEIDIEGLIFRNNERSVLVKVLIEKSFLERFRGNIPAKIFKISEKKTKKIQVSFYFDNLDFLNEWLLQFGNAIEIEGPESLRKKRKALLEEMLNQ